MMILFDQTYVEDGQICGSVVLDGESIGEFHVSVPQWDQLRWSAANDPVVVLNEKQVLQVDEASEQVS